MLCVWVSVPGSVRRLGQLVHYGMKIALVLEAIITNPLVAHLACSWQYVSAYDEQDGVSLSLCSTETKKNVFLSITESEKPIGGQNETFFHAESKKREMSL